MCSNYKKKKNVIKLLFFLYITKNNAIPSLSFFSSNKKVYNLNINLSEKIHYLGEFFYKFFFFKIYIKCKSTYLVYLKIFKFNFLKF